MKQIKLATKVSCAAISLLISLTLIAEANDIKNQESDLCLDVREDKPGGNVVIDRCEGASLRPYQVWISTFNTTAISPLPLPTSASNGASTWTIDARGGVQGSITYTVGGSPGGGSKKYSSGVVVEFLDGSTYFAEATKTVGRPFSGTRKGTHTVNAPSISLDRVGNVRRVFVHYNVETDLSTIRAWKDEVLDLLDEAEEDYERLKENGLVQDAAKASGGGS